MRIELKEDHTFSTGEIEFISSISTELEVQDFFLNLVKKNNLKGYSIPQINNSGINDLLFNFKANFDDEFIWHRQNNKLGLKMQGEIVYDNRWIEFKKSLSSLIEELEARDDTPGKKWFNLIDLVVVASLDGGLLADGEWSLDEINSNNINQRVYYGATHILTDTGGQSKNIIDLSKFS